MDLSTLENKALFVQGIYGELHALLRSASSTAARPRPERSRPPSRSLEVYEAALESRGDRVEVRARAEA